MKKFSRKKRKQLKKKRAACARRNSSTGTASHIGLGRVESARPAQRTRLTTIDEVGCVTACTVVVPSSGSYRLRVGASVTMEKYDKGWVIVAVSREALRKWWAWQLLPTLKYKNGHTEEDIELLRVIAELEQ